MVTNEYLNLCIMELNNIITISFKKLNYEIGDIQSKLDLLTKDVKHLQQGCKIRNPLKSKIELQDHTDQFTEESTVNKNLKHAFDFAKMTKVSKEKDGHQNQQTYGKVASTEFSVDIVDKTPSKEQIFRKRKIQKIERCLEEYVTGGNQAAKITGTCNSYDPFAMVDKAKSDWLDSWMKIEKDTTVDLGTCDGDVDKSFFSDLMTPKKWLDDRHINAAMSLLRRRLSKVTCPFRSERLAFMDVPFTILMNSIYRDFSKNPKEFVWSSMVINYFNGVLPQCGKTGKRFGVDVDDVYVVLNINNNHWIALAISIPRQQIDVYDSSVVHTDDKDLFQFVKPYAKLFPHFIRSLSLPVDQSASVAQYTIKMQNRIPRNIQSGDCGIYALKYIECLALNCDMQTGLCDANMKNIRKKMAAEIFSVADHSGRL